ncbi:hypothetical protein BGW39_003798 [Mortierella sp. 14UC]|nr:hypothetical protein BGW39_003798 [Mortierella sp. 14UC]
MWPINRLQELVYAIALRRFQLVNLSKTAFESVLQEVDLTKLELLIVDDEVYDRTTEAILVKLVKDFSEKLALQLGSKSAMAAAKKS